MATAAPSDRATRLEKQLCAALDTLEAARPLAKALHQGELYTVAVRLLKEPGGVQALYGQAPRFEAAGAFHGGDWDHPTFLDASFVASALQARGPTLAIECLSELRFLAIAEGRYAHPQVTPDYATAFLAEVIGHNINLLFPEVTEATRDQGPLTEGLSQLFRFLAERVGYERVLAALVDEAEARLNERPILVRHVVEMVRIAGRTLARDAQDEVESGLHLRARRLVAAVEGPTPLALAHASPAAYEEVLAGLDSESLHAEAAALGEAMQSTGLVCPQHAVLVRRVASESTVLAHALGLGPVGRASLGAHRELVEELARTCVHPDTAQCLYGLAGLLERGGLFFLPVRRELRRLMHLPIHPDVERILVEAHRSATGDADAERTANAILVAGTLSVLGQPLGLGQGDNPTCQSARAISLWAHVDIGYLLDCIAQVARDDELVMHFEGTEIASGRVAPGLVETLHTDLDVVSLVLVPHLDRIYGEMSRLVVGRGEDGHKWINPEFHGWWVDRGFATTIDFATGGVSGFDAFVRLFYATHHPEYRGNAELSYPQPAGVAATDGWGTLLGWHAISIERVARDAEGVVRVYFFNPNTHSRQRWGQGIETSTGGHGERFGESSLPFEQFASRLYLFHYNTREHGPPEDVPADAVHRIEACVRESWAADLDWLDEGA